MIKERISSAPQVWETGRENQGKHPERPTRHQKTRRRLGCTETKGQEKRADGKRPEKRQKTTGETAAKLQIADGDLEDREKPPFPKAKRLRQRRSRRQKDEGQHESHEVGGRKFILK